MNNRPPDALLTDGEAGIIFDASSGCRLYTGDTFDSLLEIDGCHLFVFHHNIMSFNKNFDELSVFLDKFNTPIDVMVLTETWFSSQLVYDVQGYTGYHC
jgi:hypothetical protein